METLNDSDLQQWVDAKLASLEAAEDWKPASTTAFTQLQNRRRSAIAVKRRWLVGSVAAALATSAALAFPQSRVMAERCVAACLAETSRLGSLVVATMIASKHSGGTIPPSSRTVAPDFTLPDAYGREVQLSKLRGKVVLLNFWATWCPPCRMEIPCLADFATRYREQGLEVIGISVDENGWKAVRPFLETQPVDYPIAIGGDAITRLYGGLESVPTTILIDRHGRIASTHVGIINKSSHEPLLQTLISEQ